MKTNYEAACLFIDKYFPQCNLAILSGSTVRNESTSTSDLDIIIIDISISNCYRESFNEFGWPIEAFVHNKESIIAWIEKDLLRRKPSMPNMICEGILIKGNNEYLVELKDFSNNKLKEGPKPYSIEEDLTERYFITDLLDDLIGSRNHIDDIFILNELLDKIINYQLVKSNNWIVHNKRLQRSLIKFNQEIANKYFSAINEFYINHNKNEILNLLESVLIDNGGRVFKGYSIGKT
jgi:hypothetical protein